MCNSVLSKICLLLAIIGGLNWGFVGIWKLDIIAWLLGGQTSWAARTVYILVAAAPVKKRKPDTAKAGVPFDSSYGTPALFCLSYCFVLHRRSNCGSSATVTVKSKNLHRVKWRFLVY